MHKRAKFHTEEQQEKLYEEMLNADTNGAKGKRSHSRGTEEKQARAILGENPDQRQMWVESAKCNNSHALADRREGGGKSRENATLATASRTRLRRKMPR